MSGLVGEQEIEATFLDDVLHFAGLLACSVVDGTTFDEVVRSNLATAIARPDLIPSHPIVLAQSLSAEVVSHLGREDLMCLCAVLVLVAAIDIDL